MSRLLKAALVPLLLLCLSTGASAGYRLESACLYTYGPTDEIRLDRTYVSDDAGTETPFQDFNDGDTGYYCLEAVASGNGHITVTYEAGPPIAQANTGRALPAILAVSCTAIVLAGAATILSCGGKARRTDHHDH